MMSKGVENELIEYQSICIRLVCTCFSDSMLEGFRSRCPSMKQHLRKQTKQEVLQVDSLLLL